MPEETIKCPHCLSDINARATVCPVCTRDIKPTAKAKSGGGIIRWLAALSLVVVCCIGSAVIGLPVLIGLTAGGNDAPTPTAGKIQPAPSLADVLANYREMTDAQWNSYAETLVGKRAIDWSGVVTQVDEGEVLGGFTVFVDGTGTGFSENIYIEVTEAVGMELEKDQRIAFSGDIILASNAVGLAIRLNNAEINPVEAGR